MAIQTTNMNLDKPQIGVETWARAVDLGNLNIDKIDLHDHSHGKGKPVPTAGLNIDEDLTFNTHSAKEMKSVEFKDVSHSDIVQNNSFYRVGNSFFYRDSSGVAINILNFIPGSQTTNVIGHIFTLPNNTDLDTLINVTANSIYFAKGGQVYSNTPAEFDLSKDFIVWLLTDNSQYIHPMSGSFYYKRSYVAGSWSAWTIVENSPLSAGQVKNLYESNDDTNVFTNAEKEKLNQITATELDIGSSRGDLWASCSVPEGNNDRFQPIAVDWTLAAIAPVSIVNNDDGTLTLPYLKPSDSLIGLWFVGEVNGVEFFEIYITWDFGSSAVTKAFFVNPSDQSRLAVRFYINPDENNTFVEIRDLGTNVPANFVLKMYPAVVRGETGPAGAAGQDGMDGAQGPAGAAGQDGMDGAQGPAGAAGQDGMDGAQGPAGAAGQDGMDGAQGPAGAAGQDGMDGAQGPAGAAGQDGMDGQDGAGSSPTKTNVYPIAKEIIQEGTNVTVTPDDTAETLTVSVSSSSSAAPKALQISLTSIGSISYSADTWIEGGAFDIANAVINEGSFTSVAGSTGRNRVVFPEGMRALVSVNFYMGESSAGRTEGKLRLAVNRSSTIIPIDVIARGYLRVTGNTELSIGFSMLYDFESGDELLIQTASRLASVITKNGGGGSSLSILEIK